MSSPPPDPSDRKTPRESASTEHWDEYWRFGFVTSCGETFSGNYEGGLASAWEAFFSTLADGTTILDVGTGNGAIAMIANRISRIGDRRFQIHGIDAADIDPRGSIPDNNPDLAGIVFHARTPIEQSGLDDNSVDVVCGQYALEYAPLDAAIIELGRICKPGAKAMFVMHHSESVVLQTAAEELRHGELIRESAFFRHAADLLQRMHDLAPAAPDVLAADKKAELCRNRLNQAAAALMAAAGDSPHPELIQAALTQVSEAIGRQGQGGGPTKSLVDGYEGQLYANLARLDDLRAAAVDATKAREIIGLFESAGFDCEPFFEISHQPGTLAGRVLRAQYAA